MPAQAAIVGRSSFEKLLISLIAPEPRPMSASMLPADTADSVSAPAIGTKRLPASLPALSHTPPPTPQSITTASCTHALRSPAVRCFFIPDRAFLTTVPRASSTDSPAVTPTSPRTARLSPESASFSSPASTASDWTAKTSISTATAVPDSKAITANSKIILLITLFFMSA